MPICDEKKLIFIHVPKNAGTSLEKTLNMRETGHKPWFTYKENFPKEWEEYKKFAIIRDPIDRFISCYDYARMEKSYWHDSTPNSSSIYGKHPDYDACNKFEINTFVQVFSIHANSLKHDGWKPQWYWVGELQYGMFASQKPNLRIDTVIEYKNLNEELKSNGIINSDLPIINKSDRKNDKERLTQHSIKLLKEFYSKDYELFYPGEI